MLKFIILNESIFTVICVHLTWTNILMNWFEAINLFNIKWRFKFHKWRHSPVINQQIFIWINHNLQLRFFVQSIHIKIKLIIFLFINDIIIQNIILRFFYFFTFLLRLNDILSILIILIIWVTIKMLFNMFKLLIKQRII